MRSKHLPKYLQKYQYFLSSAILLLLIWSCSTTRKVPDGEYLLTKNRFQYEDKNSLRNELPDYVLQKPNRRALWVFPFGLWFYNMSDYRNDTLLTEYFTYPADIRNQKLRDSLFVKYGRPEDQGKSLFWDRVFRNLGQGPVILEESKTEAGAENIRKRMVYRGFWDAETEYRIQRDSVAKKAQANYIITQNDPTKIKDFYYNIPDPEIRNYYEGQFSKSLVKPGGRLDQTDLEKEIKRINELMRKEGYYRFNASGTEIYFTADTLRSRKEVPLTMDIHKDSLDTPYRKTTIGNVSVYLLEKMQDVPETTKDSLRGINFYKLDNQYRTPPLWRPIILKPGELYSQRNLDLTKRNIAAMNNFSIINYEEELRAENDSILDVRYYLAPLPKYELRVAGDVNYSEILNFGVSPSVDLTSRNLFGGAENLVTSVSGIVGSVKNPKNDKRSLAYEASAQVNLAIPRLLLPFRYWRVLPKRYSPTSTINIGASQQNNIGLGRTIFNFGLNYFANVNDITTHKLTLFNWQYNITRNKDRYYDYFPRDGEIRDQIFQLYSQDLYRKFSEGIITSDEGSKIIWDDKAWQSQLDAGQTDLFNNFRQSLANKDRQTQDVLISSFIYNFLYNEIGRKNISNPFYLSAKFETSGNLLGIFAKNENENSAITTGSKKLIFDTPYSQFVKFDVDVRKYFQFAEGRQTLALRQFIGVGVPYGNSSQMPIIRSYFNGGSNDIRAWRVFGGLGPADSQLDERVRSYVFDNVKLTTSIEYRVPFSSLFEGAAFADAGNIWSTKDSGFSDQFKFGKFIGQMGVGAGLGLRLNVAFVTLRLDAAYKVHDPNRPQGERWVISKWQPLKPMLNFAFGYPF